MQSSRSTREHLAKKIYETIYLSFVVGLLLSHVFWRQLFVSLHVDVNILKRLSEARHRSVVGRG